MLLAHGRRRTVEPEVFSLPPSPSTDSIPTPLGSSIIHPSVVDMGAKWNGYRWWRADTPYPEEFENPSIYASNTRITWEEPPGISNPIDPWPGEATDDHQWFHSDTELVWDPNNGRFVLYWREVKIGSIYRWWAATSTNGIDWTPRVEVPSAGGTMSHSISLDPETGQWRMWGFGQPGVQWTASDPLGAWTPGDALVNFMDGDGVHHAYHGSVIPYKGVWIALYSGGVPTSWAAASVDGTTWHVSAEPIGNGYQHTLCPSTEADYLDCWQSQTSLYVRRHESVWLDLLP